MGRDRLRRGYSLEVIFEEDSDFCSHFDSLDTVPLSSAGTGRWTDAEPHKRIDAQRQDFSVKALFGVSLTESDCDNWGDFRVKSESPPSSRTSKSLDEFLDAKDMESCFIEWDEVSTLEDSLNPPNLEPGDDDFEMQREIGRSSDSEYSPSTASSGRRSRVSRRQIVEANWIMDEDFESEPRLDKGPETEEGPAARPTGPTKHYIKHGRNGVSRTLSQPIPDSVHDDKTILTHRETAPDTRDLSTDSRPPSHCNSYEDARGTRSTSPSSMTDVKRVRALFENNSRNRVEGPTPQSLDKFIKANNPKSGSGPKKIPAQQAPIKSKVCSRTNSNGALRSAYSQLSLNKMERYDFVDLLVNDNVIIEDSPDLFQTLRNSRIRDWGSGQANLPAAPSRPTTLRRSKSVGAGIHNLCEEMKREEEGRGRPCILAEEMPAPDTVKNARTVFEQMLSKPGAAPNGKAPPAASPPSGNIKSIKSNPTSKIFRSESMKTDRLFEFRRRGSKPTVLEQKVLAATAESKLWAEPYAAEEELQSLSSTVASGEELEEPKHVSDEVLNRIRSLGTTTTYFGGEIVGKTVKNHRLAVSPKKSRSFEDDYQPIEFVSNEIFYSARPNQDSGDLRPFQRDTRPRIISVLPKSPSNSPTKSNSPVGSLTEGRNSPEGCESSPGLIQNGSAEEWVNEKDDANNNSVESKKFSAADQGAWF